MGVSKMVAPLVILTMVPLLVTTRKVGTLLMVEFLNLPGVTLPTICLVLECQMCNEFF